jgi:hypothetical protein
MLKTKLLDLVVMLRLLTLWKCNTSWELEIRNSGEHEGLISTRWIDLGPGLTPEDDLLRTDQHHTPYMVLTDQEVVEDPRLRFQRDWIQAKSSGALTEDGLFCHNISFLHGQEYGT